MRACVRACLCAYARMRACVRARARRTDTHARTRPRPEAITAAAQSESADGMAAKTRMSKPVTAAAQPESAGGMDACMPLQVHSLANPALYAPRRLISPPLLSPRARKAGADAEVHTEPEWPMKAPPLHSTSAREDRDAHTAHVMRC